MRLDLFLKQTRIIKRRSIAKQMCDDGFVFVNSKKAKASTEIKKGDTIEIFFKQKKVRYRVEEVPQSTVRKNEAYKYFTMIGEEYYE